MSKQNEIKNLIIENMANIFSYSLSRTANKQGAEDLSQSILLELLRSASSIREEKAFYGWMWAVARNVYIKSLKSKNKEVVSELTEKIIDGSCDMPESVLLDRENVNLLRREIGLLSDKYRRASVMYYFDERNCRSISKELQISVDMIKYLLFKSRKILKEGIGMMREYGEKSYNPKNLSMLYWGSGPNDFFELCKRKLPQNILLCCYNANCRIEQIACETGVPAAYLEDEMEPLLKLGALKETVRGKYTTDIVIFTEAFLDEAEEKTSEVFRDMAESLYNSIMDNENKIRNIGFLYSDMSENMLLWQMTTLILLNAITEKIHNRGVKLDYPLQKNGAHAFVWGTERDDGDFSYGISNKENERNDKIQFCDYGILGEYRHFLFYNNVQRSNTLLRIARGENVENLYEKEELAYLL